jgi:hypothetical protein
MYDAVLGRFLERDTSGESRYEYVRDDPAIRVDPYGRADRPASIVIAQDWHEYSSAKWYTVRIGTCCHELELRYTYRRRFVEVNGEYRMQWKDVVFNRYYIGDRVACTGNEIGELATPRGPWLRWNSPFPTAGEVRAERPPSNPLGEMSRDGETAAASFAPHMMGD